MAGVPNYDPPRRIRSDKHTPAERAITEAHRLVEEMPPDVRLTHAGIKLQEAQSLVADFVDGVPFGEGYPRKVPQADSLRTALAHLLSKYAGVEHSGTVMGGTEIAREILADVRSVLNANPPRGAK